MKHAPTPWEIEYDNDTNGQWYRVGPAKVWFPFGASEYEVDEAKANAEFIARACDSYHDLLAALKESPHDNECHPSEGRHSERCLRARAAIAKATG